MNKPDKIKVVGLDQSLTASGVAWYQIIDGRLLRNSETWKPPTSGPDNVGKGPKRLQWIKKQLVEEFALGVDLLVIEGRAPKGMSDALSLGGLYAVIEVTALERGVPVLVVYPSARIAYMSCGKLDTHDGSDFLKQKAIELAKVEFGIDTGKDHDQADALFLAEVGASYLNLKVDDDPARIKVIENLRLTPEARKIAEQDRKLAEADRIRAQRAKPPKRSRKDKQLELFTAPTGERVWSGQGPVPAKEIVETADEKHNRRMRDDPIYYNTVTKHGP